MAHLTIFIIIINAQFYIVNVSHRNMANPSVEANAFILKQADGSNSKHRLTESTCTKIMAADHSQNLSM